MTDARPHRVQIPAYTDRWMMGDRYGTVVRVFKRRPKISGGAEVWFYEVHLDVSGKRAIVVADDCREV